VSFELWIEEYGKSVWHLVTDRVTSRSYRVVCGWRMTAADTRIYPRKPGEPGPSPETRCHTCVRAPAAITIDVSAPVSKETE
jgi:hypothetical protein